MRLAHPPGHAKMDLGEAIAVIGGMRQKIRFLPGPAAVRDFLREGILITSTCWPSTATATALGNPLASAYPRRGGAKSGHHRRRRYRNRRDHGLIDLGNRYGRDPDRDSLLQGTTGMLLLCHTGLELGRR